MTENRSISGSAIALGSFDGLHLGHRAVLERTLQTAEALGIPAGVLLFDVHPRVFLYHEPTPRLLTEAQTQAELRALGFRLHTVSFAEIRALSPAAFFKEILCGKFHAEALCCGFNYSFGARGAGSSETLRRLCEAANLPCDVAPPVTVDGVTVSSTAIRSAIAEGKPALAAAMLGRPYAISGEVIHGDRRGSTWGFPTANQKIDAELVVPKYGVYESRVVLDGKAYCGVTNIGIRPTYRSAFALAETHLPAYQGDLYGKNIRVELLRFLRPEARFDSAEALISQLKKDVAEVTCHV